MQLELLTMQFSEPEWKVLDYNAGKYGEHVEYYREWAGAGVGVSQVILGELATVFFITKDDVALFPYLAEYRQIAIWDSEESVSTLHLKPSARCLLCKDPLWSHRHDRRGVTLCDGLI